MRASILSLALCAGCGAEMASALAIEVVRSDALTFDPEILEIHVFGAETSCASLLTDIAAIPESRCSAGGRESGTCYIETTTVDFTTGTTSAALQVPVGDRQVTVRGIEDGLAEVVAEGCTGVTVTEGQTAAITVTLRDYEGDG